jgi:hypothetical protein
MYAHGRAAWLQDDMIRGSGYSTENDTEVKRLEDGMRQRPTNHAGDKPARNRTCFGSSTMSIFRKPLLIGAPDALMPNGGLVLYSDRPKTAA